MIGYCSSDRTKALGGLWIRDLKSKAAVCDGQASWTESTQGVGSSSTIPHTRARLYTIPFPLQRPRPRRPVLSARHRIARDRARRGNNGHRLRTDTEEGASQKPSTGRPSTRVSIEAPRTGTRTGCAVIESGLGRAPNRPKSIEWLDGPSPRFRPFDRWSPTFRSHARMFLVALWGCSGGIGRRVRLSNPTLTRTTHKRPQGPSARGARGDRGASGRRSQSRVDRDHRRRHRCGKVGG